MKILKISQPEQMIWFSPVPMKTEMTFEKKFFCETLILSKAVKFELSEFFFTKRNKFKDITQPCHMQK